MIRGILSAVFAFVVWGVTFANTRALLMDFSALEIMVVRFELAWAVLMGIERAARWSAPTDVTRLARGASPTSVRSEAVETTASTGNEWLFVGMGLTGVFVYQFLENCAIYYTNASNVAILVSFGPVVTALMAKVFCPKGESIDCNMWIGAAVAICGVALVSFNNAVVFEIRPLGDLMALGLKYGENPGMVNISEAELLIKTDVADAAKRAQATGSGGASGAGGGIKARKLSRHGRQRHLERAVIQRCPGKNIRSKGRRGVEFVVRSIKVRRSA